MSLDLGKVLLQKKYLGKISYVNFYNDRELIVQDINNWVKTFTKGTIKKIVSDNDIKRSTTQALLNTIYFKSKWLYPFDQNKTIKSKFYVNLDTIKIDMMNNEEISKRIDVFNKIVKKKIKKNSH